jgi:hypothetical protein
MRIVFGCFIVFGFLAMLAGTAILMLAKGGDGGGVRPVAESRRHKAIGTGLFVFGASMSLGSAVRLYVNSRKQSGP